MCGIRAQAEKAGERKPGNSDNRSERHVSRVTQNHREHDLDSMWSRREEASDLQCVYSTVKVDGKKQKKELIEWNLVRFSGECV